MRSEVSLLTLAASLRKVRAVNYTTNGYPTLIPRTTEPGPATAGGPQIVDAGTATGQSIINLCNRKGGNAPNGVLLLPFGIGSNNNTFSMRVIGWRQVGEDTPSTMLWIPVPLVEVQVTISSTQIGIAAKTIIATEMFGDTLTLTGTTANANVGVELVSPANDTIAHLIVDLKGAQKLECIFTTGGSATDCNALFALL